MCVLRMKHHVTLWRGREYGWRRCVFFIWGAGSRSDQRQSRRRGELADPRMEERNKGTAEQDLCGMVDEERQRHGAQVV